MTLRSPCIYLPFWLACRAHPAPGLCASIHPRNRNLSLLSMLFISPSLHRFQRDAGASTMLADGNRSVNAETRKEPAAWLTASPRREGCNESRSPRWFPRRLRQSAEGPVPLTPMEELRRQNRRTIGETGDFAGILGRLAYRPHVASEGVRDARIAALCVAHGADALCTRGRKSSRLPEPGARGHFEAGRYPSQ